MSRINLVPTAFCTINKFVAFVGPNPLPCTWRYIKYKKEKVKFAVKRTKYVAENEKT